MEMLTSFDTLQALWEGHLLAYFKQNKPVRLSVGVSQPGVRVILPQNGHPLTCSSRSITGAQE